jgi:hypothetical protein
MHELDQLPDPIQSIYTTSHWLLTGSSSQHTRVERRNRLQVGYISRVPCKLSAEEGITRFSWPMLPLNTGGRLTRVWETGLHVELPISTRQQAHIVRRRAAGRRRRRESL